MSRKKNKKVYGFNAKMKGETVENQNHAPEETIPEAEVAKPGFSPKEFISKGAEKAKGFGKKAWDNRGKIGFFIGAATTVAASVLLNKKLDPGTSNEEPENADEAPEEDDFESEIEDEITPVEDV